MQTLQVELVVTEQCNLGCTYCYMENRSNFMSVATLHAFKDNVGSMLELYNCRKYHVTYFGGEPLLNWDLVKYAIPFFKDDSRCASQTLVTNGLLLDEEKADFLREHGVGISLSFDGLWNDTARPLRGGQGSLQTYKDKKDLFHKIGITGSKVMVGPDAVSSLVENFKFFVDEYGFSRPDFTLVRDDVWTDAQVEVFKNQLVLLSSEIVSRFKGGQSCNAGFFSLMLMDIVMATRHGKRSMGCFAGCNGVGYMPDGVFYPCARFGSERGYPLLDTKDQEPRVFKNNAMTLLNPAVCNPAAYEGCIGCEIRQYCNGGCNKSLFEKGGCKKAEPIPQVCELFKAIFKETLSIHKQLRDNALYQSYVKGLMSFLENLDG